MVTVTWHESGPDTTEVIVYNANGVEIFKKSDLRGRIGGGHPSDAQRSERVTIDFKKSTYQDCMFKQTFSSAVQAKAFSDAWLQNQSDYVDPNPLCIGAACKYYECDAYSQALIALAGSANT